MFSSLMRSRRSRALLAVICVCVASGANLALAASPRSSTAERTATTRAERALRHAGYADVGVRCTVRKGRRATCQWDGVRKQSTCSGSLVVARKARNGRWVRLAGTSCRDVLFGFNTYTDDRAAALLHSTGATVQRIIVPWANVEPGPGAWVWLSFDQQYERALKAGLKPLMIAVSAPCWARVRSGCVDSVVSGPPDPAYEPQWQEYVRRLAERYPEAVGIEVWNEPNLTQVFWPKADPVRFTRLLSEAYTAIKAVRPQMPVISGGLLAPGVSGEGPSGMGDLTFLRGMLAAGAADSMDAIGVHPYPQEGGPAGGGSRWNPDVASRTLDQMRAIEAAANVTGKPFWITEIGESTASQSGFPQPVTPAQQAVDLVRMMRTAVASRDVQVVVIHTLVDERHDDGQNAVANLLQPLTGISLFYNGVNSGFGIFNADFKPKPAACAVSRELGGSLGC
ncbi:MAG: hypothetical protein JWO02_1835 [Solirubrobacterales bacterium]|nr:hypothetical protein [Solirubrobacterales bacterium]